MYFYNYDLLKTTLPNKASLVTWTVMAVRKVPDLKISFQL